jgi:ABC-2 type transport system ATP-binding protein
VTSTPAPAVRTTALGKRYGSQWALRDCSLEVPQGRVSALVGPNGAGKTTLLKLLAGLSRATEGNASVLGRPPAQSQDYLSSIGYLAQEVPLYKQLSGEEHIRLGAHLNRVWDTDGALERLQALRVPLDRPARTLSGGQRAQIGLAMALAKRPQVLLLDEPVAALDPLARRQFLASLASAVADGGLTVVLSSHLLHDLERVCDHIVVLSQAHPQLCADIDAVLAGHRVLVGARQDNLAVPAGAMVLKATHTARQTRLLLRLDGPVLDPHWEAEEVGLEDIVIGYMGQEDAVFAGPLSLLETAK